MLAAFASLALMAATSWVTPPPPAPSPAMPEVHDTPLVTKRCISRRASGSCDEYDYTYSVRGSSCTEDCLRFDAAGWCALRNRCTYDAGSGCFKKESCVDVSAADGCHEWESSSSCG